MTTLSIDTNELIVQADSLSDQANLSASERSGANEKVAWLKEGLKTFFDKHNATRTKLETLLTNVNGSINMKNAEVSCLQDAAKEASKNLQKAVASLKKADDNYKKLEDKSISQTQEQSKAEAGHKKAEKAMGQAYDNYMSAKNELENLQGIVPKIQAEIDETNRQLGQGLKSYAGLNNYSATDLSCMALIIRAGTLGSNIRQFAQDSQNADSQTAGLLEQQYLNNLPDNNFWEKQSGKDLIAYFNSGDKSLQEGMINQRIKESNVWALAHPSLKLDSEEDARIASMKEHSAALKDIENNDKAYKAAIKKQKDEIAAKKRAQEELDYEGSFRGYFVHAIKATFGAGEAKDGYQLWGGRLIKVGIAAGVAAAGLAFAPAAAGTAGQGGLTVGGTGSAATSSSSDLVISNAVRSYSGKGVADLFNATGEKLIPEAAKEIPKLVRLGDVSSYAGKGAADLFNAAGKPLISKVSELAGGLELPAGLSPGSVGSGIGNPIIKSVGSALSKLVSIGG